MLIDGLAVSALFALSFWIRFDGDIPDPFVWAMLRTLPIAFGVKVVVFFSAFFKAGLKSK